MGLFDGSIDRVTENIRPLLKEAESSIAAAVAEAIHGGIDRLNGAKITITIELPAAKALPVEPA